MVLIEEESSGEVNGHEGPGNQCDSVLVVGTAAELSSDNKKSKPWWKQRTQHL